MLHKLADFLVGHVKELAFVFRGEKVAAKSVTC